MDIKEYYQKILNFCAVSPLIIDFHVDFEEIDVNEGYLSGVIDLIDSSNLHIFEYIEISDSKVKRLKYRFHWQKVDSSLIARWDNVPHYKNIKTFPNHLHKDDRIFESSDIDLFKVLNEIEKLIA